MDSESSRLWGSIVAASTERGFRATKIARRGMRFMARPTLWRNPIIARMVAFTGTGLLLIAAAAPKTNWGPNGNGTLSRADDGIWTLLHDTKLTIDEAKGEYRATFAPSLIKLDDTQFKVAGFLLPLSVNWTTDHFILTRRSPGCPFCPPSDPNEAIEVFFDSPVAYTLDPISISGRLHLMSSGGGNMFYRLDHARQL